MTSQYTEMTRYYPEFLDSWEIKTVDTRPLFSNVSKGPGNEVNIKYAI